MITQTVHATGNLREAILLFLDDIREWKASCIGKYSGQPPSDIHDQLTYTTGWEPYVVATRDAEALSFLKRCRDGVRAHFTASGKWRHGYWCMQDTHHGTEHFELFLGYLFRLDPDDCVTKEHLLNAAEHMGNWCPDVPPWFDESTGLFRSLHFGADGVGAEPGSELNMPNTFRCVNICLLAYQMTNDKKYLHLACQHAGLWADAIVSSEALPVGLSPSGPVYQLTDGTEHMYPSSVIGMVGRLDEPLERAENILASGGVNTFLTLHEYAGEAQFITAAERLMDVLVTQLDDPDAGATADAIRQYRRVTGKRRYDADVERVAQSLAPSQIKEIGADVNISRDSRPAGVGKRRDMPIWYEDGEPRKCSPVLLSVAAEIASDRHLARCAVDLARTCFKLAIAHFPDGRDHGCAAQTVSAIARGHGRDNHVGMTTGVLGPIIEAFRFRDNPVPTDNAE